MSSESQYNLQITPHTTTVLCLINIESIKIEIIHFDAILPYKTAAGKFGERVTP